MKLHTLSLLLLASLQMIKAQTWSPVGGEMNSHVNALYVYDDKLYVGGNFTNIDGDAAYGLAEWDGSDYSDRNTTLYDGTGVSNFATYQGQLMVVGAFFDGLYGPGFVAVWDGTALVGEQYKLNSNVYDLLPVGDEYYVVGYFDLFEGTHYNHVAKFNGSAYETVGDGFESAIGDLCMYNDQIIAGGGNNDALTYLDAGVWTDLGTNGPAGAQMDVFQGELYGIGCFDDAVDGTSRYIAKWNGTTWEDVGGGLQGGLNCARAIYATNNYLYVAGQFTGAGGVAVNNVAKWDGENWSAVGDGIPDKIINCLAVYDGYLYAGPAAQGFSDVYLWKFSEPVTAIEDHIVDGTTSLYVYPNPADNFITITLEGVDEQSAEISIIDLSGKIIISQTMQTHSTQINIETLAPGIYLAKRIDANGVVSVSRFVVER